ncbi:MAG: hypothetical protein A4E55_02485 [Pelotomaculum sp. PtaU1.Bin035]|nr:MAG: hypothetical protein A4E55_02485 [Pelotomaculum sp. PtaU1.Bin035]
MDTDVKPGNKKESADHGPPRRIYTVPLPKDTSQCKGCPYPGVGFICWDPDGTCLRTNMDRFGRPGR